MLVLGIVTSHDAGVALVRDGQILAAINEERLDRKKMTSGIPRLALRRIWDLVNVKPGDVDVVALAGRSFQGNPPVNNDLSSEASSIGFNLKAAEFLDAVPGGAALMKSRVGIGLYRAIMPRLFHGHLDPLRAMLSDFGIRAPIRSYDHHDCHIAAAYFKGPWNECLVISNDGFGDGLCSKIAVCRDGRIHTTAANSFHNSLGQYYNYATFYCGFKKIWHPGKTTGLAAFGDASRTLPMFQELISWEPGREAYINHGPLFRRALALVMKRCQGIPREHVAAGIQRHFENILVAQATYWLEKTHLPHIALTGGLHANVRVNQLIAEIPGVEGVFVYPHMGDGGLAVGAACLAWAEAAPDKARPSPLPDVYLGPGYSDAEIEAALKEKGVRYARPSDLAHEIALRLSRGKIVARFDGRMEYGPRALGNRSILYQATDPAVNTWLNQQLRRTEFMPFAPVVRDVDAPTYFQNYRPGTEYTSQFMTITYTVTERCRREAPAIVHVDNTARPQVVRKDVNPGYYAILDAYHRETGLAVLVNTSFNMHEEPIVCSPQEAVASFFDSHIDALAVGPFLVERENIPKAS